MSATGSAEALLARYRPAVEAEIRRMLDGRSLPLYDMLRYHLGLSAADGSAAHGGNAGKGVRPALCLLACAAVGGDPERAVPAAAALELLHNFTLIHDDIEDNSPQRRHRDTVWAVWGKPQAINAGDALHVLSLLTLLRLEGRGFPADVIVRTVQRLHETSLLLCEGQSLDMAFEERTDVTEAEYLTMIGGKSAALIATSLELGALLGAAAPATVEALREAGFRLGLAFQVQDDVLGIWGDEGRMGKAASDVAQRKKSLPVVYGFEYASREDVATLARIYRAPSVAAEDVATVIAVLDRAGAKRRSEQLAWRLYEEGMQALRRSGLTDAELADLTAVAEFLIHRDY